MYNLLSGLKKVQFQKYKTLTDGSKYHALQSVVRGIMNSFIIYFRYH